MRGAYPVSFVVILAAIVLLIAGATGVATAADITGAGATFPYPLYQAWADAYRRHTGIDVDYQPVGSGNGIKRLEAGTVMFAASDIPLDPWKLRDSELFQFPLVIGGVVPVVNLATSQPGEIRLSGSVVAEIFAGTINHWSDAAIRRLNPQAALSEAKITVIHRGDSSGTTLLFTSYLSKVSPAWRDDIGASGLVEWPTGYAAKGNEGVATLVREIPGAIGYVEYEYARQGGLSPVALQGRDGNYLQPERESFEAAAAANADWSSAPGGYYPFPTNQPGERSWPITGASFIIMRKHQQESEASRRTLEFFDWAYHEGGEIAEQFDYVPIPANIVVEIEKSWERNTVDASTP